MYPSIFFVSAESSKVSQYGNEAPGAPSLQAELAKLREENKALKCSAKGVTSFVLLFCALFHIFCSICVKRHLASNLEQIFNQFRCD